MLALAAVTACAGLGMWTTSRVDLTAMRLGAVIGRGTYGIVYQADIGGLAVIAKRALGEVPFASEYFSTEEALNQLLAREQPDTVHLAPYLGAVDLADGQRFLVWRRSGERTLHDLLGADDPPRQIALALGLDPDDRSELMREVLRQLVECVAAVHACGIVHRDFKPENILVDADARALRLIDFGSACEMRGWLQRRGYRADRGPCSPLYCAPEQFLSESHPFAYDVFSVALVFLRCAMPALHGSAGRADEPLAAFRAQLGAAGGRLDLWLATRLTDDGSEAHALESVGWTRGLELFDLGGVSGRLAWRLVRAMLEPAPARRISARDALAGPYLGRSCSTGVGAGDLTPADDAPTCYVDDFYDDDAPAPAAAATAARDGAAGPPPSHTVELRLPLGLLLEEDDDGARARRARDLRERPDASARAPRRSRAAAAAVALSGELGVVVADVLEGGSALASGAVGRGDALVSVGPFDVSELGLEGVLELLSSWSAPTVRLRLQRKAAAAELR